MSLKNSFKLPGEPKEGKVRNITKLPSSNDGTVITNYTQKDVRNTFQKVTFPIFLDFSEGYYQLESDDFMKSCTNVVKELDLSSNSLIEISSLSHLTKLKRLILHKNNLVDVSLVGLSSLVYLGCCNNRLDHLSDLGDCKKLINIDLSGNRLVEGFEHLAKLKSLKVLDLSSNNICFTLGDFGKKVMDPIKKIKTLEFLSFENNPIEKRVDEFRLYVINELPKLKYLNWTTVTKEERTKAAKLEADGFWVKLQQIQQQQLLQQQQQQPTPVGRASFVQRKPSLVGMGMSPKLSSSLSRSTDVFMGSAPSISSSSSNIPNINASLAAAAEGSTPPIPVSAPMAIPNMKLTNEDTPSASPARKASPGSDSTDFGSVRSTTSTTSNPPVSASDLTREQSMSYLDMILNELPSPNADFSTFTSVLDQKLYLDLLYRAIVEDSIPDELQSMTTTISSSSSSFTVSSVAEPVAANGESPAAAASPAVVVPVISSIVVPEEDEMPPVMSPFEQRLSVAISIEDQDEEVLQVASVVDTMSISQVSNPTMSIVKESSSESLLPTIKLDKSSEIIQPSTPITTTTTTTTTEQVKVPSPVATIKKSPIPRTTKSEATNPAIEVKTQQFSATKDIWKKISENESPSVAAKTTPTPVAKPFAVKPPATTTPSTTPTPSTPIALPAKPPGKMIIKKVPIKPAPGTSPVIKPAPGTSPVIKPLVAKTPAAPVSPPTVPVVAKTPATTATPTTPPPTHKLENTLPKPIVTLTENGAIDIDHFNLEMEKALADIENTFALPVVKPAAVVTPPVVEQEEQVEKVEVLETVAATTVAVAAPIPQPPPMMEEEEPPKVVEQQHTKPTIPKSLLSNIVKKEESPLEQVESASSALDEMIQAYSNTSKSNANVKATPVADNSNVVAKQQPPQQQQQPPYQSSTPTTIITCQPSLPPPSSMSFGLDPWIVPHSSVQVGAKLGMGTFGDCYTGRIDKTNSVLLKKLRIQRFSDQFLNQFKNEVTHVKQLVHENLVPVVGCCVDNNIYIVNTHPSNGTSSLQQLLDNQQFQVSNEFIHRVSYSVSRAMVYLHQHDTIHRALKPSNVIVEHKEGGRVLVGDYAFCFIKDSVYNTGQHGNAYMAPELFNSSCNSYDQLSDQFSFGMLLWQLFSRVSPFADVQNSRIKEYITSGHRPELSDAIPTVFNRLIRACWNPDASSRPTFLTISKILSQPFQRIFAVSPTAKPNQVISSPIPITGNNNGSNSGNNGYGPTITHQAKHQFSETGQLKKKMNLVLEKITSMLFDPSPDSVKKALKALENLSSPENHQHIIGIGMMSNLVKIANNGGAFLPFDVKEQILRVLYSLCTNETLSNEFISSGGFVPLKQFINSQELSIVLASIKLLSVLADEQQLEQVRHSGLLEPLLALLGSDNENIVSQVVGALSRVLLDTENQRFFIENGSVPLLIEMMDSPQNGLSMRALLALCCLITNPACKQQLLDADMISKLMELLASPQKLLRLHTLKIVQNMSKDQEFRNLMVQSNCIDILVAQMESYSNNSIGNHSNNEILCLIFESLGSLLKNQSDITIFFNCRGVDHLVKFITYNQTDDILNGVLSITYSLVHHEQSRNILRQIIPRLVELLSKSTVSSHIIIQILYVLTLFSNHTSSLESLDSTMIFSVISTLLIANSNNHEIKLNALKFISGTARLNANKLSVTQLFSILSILVEYLSEKSTAIKEEAIATISWLSANNECRSVLLQKGVLKHLINYKSTNNDCNERLLWAISFFAFDEMAQSIMRENIKVFEFITDNLEKDQEVFKTLAIKSTLILAQKPLNKQYLINAGIQFPLQILQNSQSRSIALASKKILSLLE
ncbi:hypothetical protein CYY_003122 [Polysphondylium violaceum]|uniref:Protein kinase domain-containing protein n=1 Tax=Polysphondylium violaceum TaxID=133409 RepID=A0A8J4Q0E1_9MYCE|nr:hypothetical protein CYY_003122 [Polysphondylium violaceum]